MLGATLQFYLYLHHILTNFTIGQKFIQKDRQLSYNPSIEKTGINWEFFCITFNEKKNLKVRFVFHFNGATLNLYILINK